MIGFEIVFRLLTFLVIFPILTWTQRLWLVGNRTKVIAWYNAKEFLLNPITWIVLIFMIMFLVWAAMFEQFAIYDTLHASSFGMRRTTRQVISAGFDMCVERIKPANWTFIPYVLIIMNAAKFTDISSVTSILRIPGFILEDFEKRPWEQVAYSAVMFVAAVLYFLWIFAIPIMMEEDGTNFPEACKKSARMVKGKYFFRILALRLFWSILAYIVYGLGSSLIVTVWYLLSMWVIPGETEEFILFFFKRIIPTSMMCTIFFTWMVVPLMASSFQAAYYARKEELGSEVLDYTEPPHYLRKYPILKIALAAVCVVSIFFSVPRRFAQIRWSLNTDYGLPMIMAHRGFSAETPENTLPAFQKCIDEGFSAAELDVQMLADGTIIVMHDDNLKRTTGVDKNVWEVTYDEIKNLDNGAFFDPEFEGTKICTLDEAIKLAASAKDKLYLNIEIKRNGHDDGIAEKVVQIILDNNYLNYCDITSQDYSTLEEVREINPYVLTAYTSVIGIGNIESLEAADIISIQETFATYENIERIHNAGKRVFVWTINEQDTMEQLANLNVDAILTNDPRLCQEVFEGYASNAMNIVHRIQYAFSFL
ncbi:MAG: glycerophosphoryl diester phosphodiesterase membrane domain-containing protein [Lachnospiraceae bacterium]|nr:glycerophosphoryl diester phosphodiesterase membrane domain-containing protein [Lachnospiraceae bacterium]